MESFKAIPGGRYGCAQFVKICGPDLLKALSLGRLAQMIQQTVTDDLLRYHKTLLIWTNKIKRIEDIDDLNQISQREELDCKRKRELEVIKSAVIEILQEQPQGVSLAQMPQHLKKKVPFDFNLSTLGFPKLKDLILSMSDQVKIELKGQNHPYASLIAPKVAESSPEARKSKRPDEVEHRHDLVSQLQEELNITDSFSSESEDGDDHDSEVAPADQKANEQGSKCKK